VRFTAWKNTKSNEIKGLSFGGSFEHSRSKGLANEAEFQRPHERQHLHFFPQFKINGSVERLQRVLLVV